MIGLCVWDTPGAALLAASQPTRSHLAFYLLHLRDLPPELLAGFQ
jgi:hypothetical protein